MIREPFRFRQTFATILAEYPEHVAAAREGMIRARQVLEAQIARDPFFQMTFDPYIPDSSELVIRRMADASKKAGVGPMAAVAGAIAWAGVESMADAGAVFGVIDNGGISLLSATARYGLGYMQLKRCSQTGSLLLSRHRIQSLGSVRPRHRSDLQSLLE